MWKWLADSLELKSLTARAWGRKKHSVDSRNWPREGSWSYEGVNEQITSTREGFWLREQQSFINPCSCLAHNYLPSTEASKLEDRIREAMQFSHYQLLGWFFFFLPLLKLAPLSPKPPSCHGITRRQHATSLQQEKHPTKSRV